MGNSSAKDITMKYEKQLKDAQIKYDEFEDIKKMQITQFLD